VPSATAAEAAAAETISALEISMMMNLEYFSEKNLGCSFASACGTASELEAKAMGALDNRAGL
jgi:hypothetical protein